MNLPINHPRHTFKFFNPYTKKVFTSRNVTWTGLTWGEYEKISLENYFHKKVVVLASDEENEDDHLINVNRPNIQEERVVEVLNANNDENGNSNSGRVIRDSPLRLNINIPENIDDFQDLLINTPNYDDRMESVESPPMNSDQFNHNEQGDSRIISVHSSDMSYTPSDTLIF